MLSKKREYATQRLLPGTAMPDGSLMLSDVRCQIWCRVSGTTHYLDGNQHTGSVQTIAESLARQPRFTGVNWVMKARPDGLWLLLNQGDPDFALLGVGNNVQLGSLSAPATKDTVAEWIVYVTNQGKLLLRPALGEWLIAQDNIGGVGLGRCSAADTLKSLWTIVLQT